MASVRLLLMVALRSTAPGKGEASKRIQGQLDHSGQNRGLWAKGLCDTGDCL